MERKSSAVQKIFVLIVLAAFLSAALAMSFLRGGAEGEAAPSASENAAQEEGTADYAGKGEVKMFERDLRADGELLAAKPRTLPQGSAYTEIRTIGGAEYTVDRFENDDWDHDTYAAEYGRFQGADGTEAYYLVPAGGDYEPSAEFWISAVSLDTVAGVLFYIDFSDLFTKEGVRVGLQLGASGSGGEWDISKLIRYDAADGADGYYYEYASGEWKNAAAEGGSIALPDGYEGWVYFPLDLYADAQVDGTETDVGTDGVSAFVQMLHLAMPVGDLYETASQIVFDDFTFVAEGAEHEHEYSFVKTVAPTCTAAGADIWQCACGQVKYENGAAAAGHSYSEWTDGGGGLAYAVCEDCGRAETEAREGAPAEGETVTVTFDHGKAGGSTVKKFPQGYTLSRSDIPWKFSYGEEDIYQFICWTIDEAGIIPLNPAGLTLSDGDLTLYAQYSLCSYDRGPYGKFLAMMGDVSFNGGPYDLQSGFGKTIVMGNSNYSLWHSMESYFAGYGMTVVNNSINGASSYNYVEFLPNLVLRYQPQAVIVGTTSNDMSYHQMTDKAILKNMEQIYESVRENSPHTVVLFGGAISLPGRPEYRKNVERVNAMLEEFCERNERAEYIDLSGSFTEFCEEHVYPDGWDTWTHLDQEGLLQVFGENMLRKLQEVEQRYGLDL